MAEHSISVGESKKSITLPTSARHIIRLTRFNARVLEMEDVHFHFDSAVLLPDFELQDAPDAPDPDRVTGIAVLRACLIHARTTSDYLLIAGHTDTSGPPDYNLMLSHQRAKNVLHALTGDRSAWVQSSQAKHRTEDFQQIVKWVARVWEWDCDPGPIDDIPGPRTKAAIKEFQRAYNLDFGASITGDGIVGEQTWGAFFDVYMEVLKLILETDEKGLAEYRQTLRFVDSGRPTVGCGENFPMEAPRRDQYRSQLNRRVELLFFDPDKKPTLQCHPGGNACTKTACDIYHLRHFKMRHLPVTPITIKTLKRWVIRVVEPGSGPPATRKALADEEYVVTGAGGPSPEIRGRTDARGVLRILVYDDPCTMTLKVGRFKFRVQAGGRPKVYQDNEGVKCRLHNLGYGPPELAAWDEKSFSAALKHFQRDHGLTENGMADAVTRSKLRDEHGS